MTCGLPTIARAPTDAAHLAASVEGRRQHTVRRTPHAAAAATAAATLDTSEPALHVGSELARVPGQVAVEHFLDVRGVAAQSPSPAAAAEEGDERLRVEVLHPPHPIIHRRDMPPLCSETAELYVDPHTCGRPKPL